MSQVECICKPLPDDKILALSKFKAFADDNIIVAHMVKFLFERVENIVGKGKKGLPAFSTFPHFFNRLPNKTWSAVEVFNKKETVFYPFHQIHNCCLQILSNLSFGKGFKFFFSSATSRVVTV